MSLVTISATIAEGRIVPDEPDKIPSSGRALITVLPESASTPKRQPTVAELMGDLAGIGSGRLKDLSTNPEHLRDIGE
jgi:hypothetical protein